LLTLLQSQQSAHLSCRSTQPEQRLDTRQQTLALCSPTAQRSFTMSIFVSYPHNQSLSSLPTFHDIPMEKEACVVHDMETGTMATETGTEGDLMSQTSSSSHDAEDEHDDNDESNTTTSFSFQHMNEELKLISSGGEGESVSSRKSSILKRSVSCEDIKYIKAGKRPWRCLPSPNLEEIVRRSASLDTQTQVGMSPSTKAQSVHFGMVTIRSYAQTLGDNPSCSYGPPIQLDWDYEEYCSLGVDAYEDKRPPRRSMRQMVLSYYIRKNLLIYVYGISEIEFKEAKRRINREKLCRSVTASSLMLMPVEAAIESATRKAKRLLGKKTKD